MWCPLRLQQYIQRQLKEDKTEQNMFLLERDKPITIVLWQCEAWKWKVSYDNVRPENERSLMTMW